MPSQGCQKDNKPDWSESGSLHNTFVFSVLVNHIQPEIWTNLKSTIGCPFSFLSIFSVELLSWPL